MKSEQINELAMALSKAQGELENAAKDGTNPHLKSRYATLASVIETSKPVLANLGLAVVQTTDSDDVKQICLDTTLVHSSGQWIKSRMPLLLSKADMQGIGSAITYARRIGWSSIIGMTHGDSDDDAHTATTQTYIQKNAVDYQKPAAPLGGLLR